MSLDDSYIGPYLQDWLVYIRKSCDAEQRVFDEGSEFRVPYAGVPMETTKALFIISDRFGVEVEAKYLAVHLLDRYLGRLFWERFSSLPEVSDESMRQVLQHMSSRLKLALASCLQIASKANLFRSGLCVSQVQDLLQSIDPLRDYPRKAIVASELEVLRSLDFRIPTALPLSVLELLLVYSRLPRRERLRETCLLLLDVAYMRHEHLFGQLHLMARGFEYDKSRPECRDFLRLELDAGFVAAAVLLCCAFFFRLRKGLVDALAARLAKLLDMDPGDLSAMANLLFVSAIDEDDFLAARSADDEGDDDAGAHAREP